MLECKDGEYRPSAAELKEVLKFRCAPVCLGECLHGGECNSPFYCDCPSPWMGATCEANFDEPCVEDIDTYSIVKGHISPE